MESVNVSNVLLQEAFSALTLADKCALSLSMNDNTSLNSTVNTTMNVNGCVNGDDHVISSMHEFMDMETDESMNSNNISTNKGVNTSFNINNTNISNNNFINTNNNDTSTSTNASWDLQSVLSDIDKESVDAAMSLMGDEVSGHFKKFIIVVFMFMYNYIR
jgi:hypothetical protein